MGPRGAPARRRRTVSLLVAAALVLGGSALAAVRTGAGHEPDPRLTTPVFAPVGTSFGPNDRGLVPPPARPGPEGGDQTSPGSPGGATGPGGEGSSVDGGSGSSSTDDPNDRDHGTGNDGSHDDRGGGNDGPTGSAPVESHGHGSP